MHLRTHVQRYARAYGIRARRKAQLLTLRGPGRATKKAWSFQDGPEETLRCLQTAPDLPEAGGAISLSSHRTSRLASLGSVPFLRQAQTRLLVKVGMEGIDEPSLKG